MRYVYLVTEVILEDRLDCCHERLENTEVRIGAFDYNVVMTLNPLCYLQDTKPVSSTSIYTCTDGPMEGRYVMVRKVAPTSNDYYQHPGAWHIRELRVFVAGSPNSE